jgi:cholesterol transport system auxiliary component
MSLKKNKHILVPFFVFGLTLTACGPLVDLGGNAPVAARYRLALIAQPAQSPLKLDPAKNILVDDLAQPADLATDRLAIRIGAQEVRYLAAMRWTDRPGRMMRELISAYGQSVEGFTILGSTQLDVRYDFRLSGRLEGFHVEMVQGRPPMAKVSFQAVLIHRVGGRTVAIQNFSAQAPAENDGILALTSAINKAANQAAQQAIGWAAAHAG